MSIESMRISASGGWAFAPHWSVEALYLDAGHFVASDLVAGTAFHGSVRLTAWGATLGYAWPLGTQFTVGARLGMASVSSTAFRRR